MKFNPACLLPAAAALCGCTHLFFQPSAVIFSDPAAAGTRYEVIKFASGDGTELTGMYFPPAGPPRGTVVHFHGNAQNMTAHYPYSAWLAKEGFNVFIFDYRGYGASGGRPGLDGLVQDGIAALKQAEKLPGAEPGKIIVLGQSLGGAVAVAAAAESGLKPAALVLAGTVYSDRGVAAAGLRRHWWGWPALWLPYVGVSGRHAPSDHIGELNCPKLFIHSVKDPVVPFEQGKKLYDAAPGPKEFLETPDGHIEAFTAYRETFAPKLLEFLKQIK